MKDTAAKGRHQVQIYDTEVDLLDRLVKYIGTALRLGSDAIVVCRPALAQRLHLELHREHVRGLPFGQQRGQLRIMDAEATLALFMVEGWPDPGRFSKHVGALFENASDPGKNVVAYGEMVALLCEHGDFATALRLAALWNELLAKRQFTLLCSYPSKLFTNMPGQSNYAHICGMHDQVYAPAAETGELLSR